MSDALAAITVDAPEGAPWEFFVLFAVVILGPPLVSKARVPGLIGLLIGGFLIGPNGLGWIEAGNTTIPDLGAIGLLYLMFVAGVELDLGLLRIYRRSAILFGITTFMAPMVLGTAVGLALSWGWPAALLLGSLLASHTLILYPVIRNAGLASDPVVASAVGATVLTDTLALIVLAGVSGSETGSGSSVEIALQIVLGLSVLIVFAFLVLPPLARIGFRLLGTDRAIRYVMAIAAFLAAAMVAEMFGIEGIVGAFFAGLSLNRLVPNRGPLMGRIDFFGNAVFVPIFLVSVGLLLKPSVMVEPETLGLAGLLIVACLGGKGIAALMTGPLLGADRSQAGLVFALTTPQAAATLAATTVGFEIGLFSESVVNAVLVLILVSVTVATIVAERSKVGVSPPSEVHRELGEHVLVAVEDPEAAELSLRIGAGIAEPVGGAVEVMLLESVGSTASSPGGGLSRLEELSGGIGLDSEPSRLAASSFAEGVFHAALSVEATLIVAAERHDEGGSVVGTWAETVSGVGAAPVAIVRGRAEEIDQVHLVSPGGIEAVDSGATAVAQHIGEALSGSELANEAVAGQGWTAGLEPGAITIAPIGSWALLSGMPEPPRGAGLVLVPEPLVPPDM